MTVSPTDFELAQELANEVAQVAASLGISPAELVDRAVRRELARQLLEGVFGRAGDLEADEAMRLVYAERDAARTKS